MTRAREFLRRIFFQRRKIGGDTKRLPSLARAVKALVPRSVMKEVVGSSHDRRQWGVLAAAWVGVSEREFMSAAARELRMSYQDHVATPDLTLFGSHAREMMLSLRKAGAAMVLDGARIVGFVAVDPAEVRGLSWYDGTQTVSMAPWTAVARALDLAERMILEYEANADRYESMRKREQCEKVMRILIGEAVSHGAFGLDILTDGEQARYQFTTVEGKVAAGGIHRDVFESLIGYVTSFDNETLMDPSVGSILVRSIGGPTNLRLSWGRSTRAQENAREVGEQPEQSPRLAREALEEKPRVADNSRRVASEPEQISVLVVDDNPMFCRVLERMLKREGCEVAFAEDGKIAIERLRACVEHLPKVVICDLHMPRMSGSELVRAMKADPQFAHIPILMLTSDEGADTEVSALELGVDVLVGKSRDPRILCAHISRLARRAGVREAA